jgi:hypothetical protein
MRPLLVDPDAELALPVAGQRLEVITRRNPQVLKGYGSIQLNELPQSQPNQGRRNSLRTFPLEELLGLAVAEALNHLPDRNATRYGRSTPFGLRG